MTHQYSIIPGLNVTNGSDFEYVEHWESVHDSITLRKTISGDTVIEGQPLQMLTLSGMGHALPECALTQGQVVTITPSTSSVALSMRLEKWSYKYCPWEFKYAWTFIFKEVISCVGC